MGILEIVIVGLALSMDAFAVTLANTAAHPHLARPLRLLMPISFGVFQGLMPVLGFLLAGLFAGFIQSFAGIISFLILVFIGGKMVFEGISRLTTRKEEEEEKDKGFSLPKQLGVGAILSQAVATSIDAFMVGVGFVASSTNVAEASSIIALCTFACCLLGLIIGKRFGLFFGEKAIIVGGIILVFIGLKALLF